MSLLLSPILMNCWNIIHAHLLRCAFFCLFSSPSHSSVHILFRLPHFARPASRKTELQKNYLRLEGIAKHKGFLEIYA